MKALILVLALVASACAKVTPETPKAATAIKADEVLLRVKELQSAVLTACWPDGVMKSECVPGGISTPAMREFVKATIDVAKVAKEVPAGWQATVKASWGQAKPRILALVPFPQAVQIALGIADTLIGGLL
jgi:hypothetical protein